ncbi:hypothetical protein CO024_01880 [Candidatus Gracilibacteria bacterium CG_4_9_14_0_2_um_filter_38_7]|nr:MAG: hypothetical protein CO024_01880 [Candidatus Gracilibacteria bacterium CG_4_9_14_0_2_um_filter_38_7]
MGQTVGGFTSTLAGTITTYIWSCNGSAVGGACAATYDSPPLPYSACIFGNPAADCNTNTYATQAACLIANPVGSGRTCYFNDIVSCNATRATQCPGGGGLTCTPGNFTRDAGGVVPTPLTVVTPGLCPVGEIVGNFTDITNGNLHRYAWSCNGIIAGLACTAFYSTGGGGGGGSCQIGSITGVQTTPITISTPGLCAAGLGSVSNFTSTTTGTTTTYTWSCGGVSGCSTTYTTTGGGGTPTPTPTTIRTVPGSSSYCGNGIIERPNMLGQYESCDIVAPWCASCNIALTNPGSIPPGNLTITTPGSTSININAYRLIIGDQVPVFSVGDSIVFETTTPMYLQNKTATITNNSSLINGTTISKTINNGIGGPIQFEVSGTRTYDNSGNLLTITYNETRFPNTLKLFDGSELQGFKGDTNVITPVGYKDTIISNPTYRGQGIYASIAYLEAPFSVRVSKPIISNTAGGSAFIGSFLGNNVNTVVNNFLNALKSGNFTTSTVNASSSYALSSATKSISDNNISEIITSGGQNEEGKISQSSINTTGIYMPIDITSVSDLVSKSVPLGDNESVRVFKNGDVSISGNMDLSGVKTIIVENGNLIINNDIRYADKTSSYAWIIKNGNVIITHTVGNIAGMYITLAGAIVSNGISTSNRLAVDGSLYGNTSDLVNNRSYVRGQTDSTALNVGVVINYSNRAIAYPPPFFTRFLEQYSLQRVAR